MADHRFRNRVVGALVLVSLAVIFVPMILTGQGHLDMGYHGPDIPPEPVMNIPEKIFDKPVLPSASTDAPQVTVIEPGTIDEAEMAAARAALAASPPSPSPPSASSTVESPAQTWVTPQPSAVTTDTPRLKGAPAWAVQVGSFANQASALLLRDQLRAKKFAAYVESVPSVSGATTPVFRVRIGPELQQALAESLRERVSKETGLKGIVVSHRQ